MLTNSQEKLIKSLHEKKGRKETKLCLVEGEKFIEVAEKFVQYTFTSADSNNFKQLVTTETPQDMAAVCEIPKFSISDIKKRKITVLLDNVQDPGNIGTIMRLCLAFDASLLLLECADPTSPKVIRSSAGALFHLPWIKLKKDEHSKIIRILNRPIYKLENKKGAKEYTPINKECIIIAGSEGRGIQLQIPGESNFIRHNSNLESLNVASALAIILQREY